jgi:hypothetical protein
MADEATAADVLPSKRRKTLGSQTHGQTQGSETHDSQTQGSETLLQPCVLAWMGNNDLRLLLQVQQCSPRMRRATNDAHQGPRWIQGLQSKRVRHVARKLLLSRKPTTHHLPFNPAYDALCEMDTDSVALCEMDTDSDREGHLDHTAQEHEDLARSMKVPPAYDYAADDAAVHAQLSGMGGAMEQLAQLLQQHRIPHRWLPLLLIVLGHLPPSRVRALTEALAGVNVKHRARTTHTVLTLLCSPVVYGAWTFSSAGSHPPPIDPALAPHAFVHETLSQLRQLQTNPMLDATLMHQFRCEGNLLDVQLVVDEPGCVELRIGTFKQDDEGGGWQEPRHLHGKGAVITSVATNEPLAEAPQAGDPAEGEFYYNHAEGEFRDGYHVKGERCMWTTDLPNNWTDKGNYTGGMKLAGQLNGWGKRTVHSFANDEFTTMVTVGYFVDNELHGKGCQFVTSPGAFGRGFCIEIGRFVNGRLHGPNCKKYRRSTFYEEDDDGEFESGQMHGPGSKKVRITGSQGQYCQQYEGTFANNRLHNGVKKFNTCDGSVVVETFEMGRHVPRPEPECKPANGGGGGGSGGGGGGSGGA